MKKMILSAAVALAGSDVITAQTNWNVDVSHSRLSFTVSHMMISEVDGKFKIFNGTVNSPADDFQNAQIEFTVDVASINTDDEKRDGHLKSDDFFNAEKFPKMTFKSASFKKVSGNKYLLTGDLTIRDVTKKVSFEVIYNGTRKDPWGNTKAGFKLTGKINRLDYNLKWNVALEAGGVLVGEEVNIVCDIELAKQK